MLNRSSRSDLKSSLYDLYIFRCMWLCGVLAFSLLMRWACWGYHVHHCTSCSFQVTILTCAAHEWSSKAAQLLPHNCIHMGGAQHPHCRTTDETAFATLRAVATVTMKKLFWNATPLLVSRSTSSACFLSGSKTRGVKHWAESVQSAHSKRMDVRTVKCVAKGSQHARRYTVICRASF